MGFSPRAAGFMGDWRSVRWLVITNFLFIASWSLDVGNSEVTPAKTEGPEDHSKVLIRANSLQNDPISDVGFSSPALLSSSVSPTSPLRPPLEDNNSGSFNGSSESPISAQPPSTLTSHVFHGPGCCGPNMINKRGSHECHCVYPVKVGLHLFNVSLSSDWSDKFLERLASQLHLRVSQLEIVDFYVVGVSGLNITMNIVPHSGFSFTDAEINEMNASLRLNKVYIDGGYKLLNFTSFKPLSPSPVSKGPPSALPPSFPVQRPSTYKNGGRSSNLVLLIGISVGSLIAVFIILVMFILCTMSKGKKSTAIQEPAKTATEAESISIDGSLRHPSSTRFLPYDELKEATNNFEPASVLGQGGFGQVFKGRLCDGTPVAIKKLSGGGHQGDREFLVEVEMLSRLHHRNLVRLVGYYTSRDDSHHLLCYELVPNGSLESWLHGPVGINCPLDWDTRMRIALDAARGLAYLHEDSQPCVIHRDFKASNILLENDFHAKVSDFGLAKQAPEGRANYLSTRVMGTFGYVAPEYAMTGHLLVKSDVYSYGVVLLELLTGRKPVDMSQPSGEENLVTWARPILRDKDRVEELADPKLEGKYPTEDFLRVCTIAAACVASEASQRPTMGEVVQSLKMVQRIDPLPPPPPRNVSASTAAPNTRQPAYPSDCTSSMFSSGPFSGLSTLDHDVLSRAGVVSEDLHEGR
ncbi:protein kinase superfamily protein isoform X2 [Wolffia australiana]